MSSVTNVTFRFLSMDLAPFVRVARARGARAARAASTSGEVRLHLPQQLQCVLALGVGGGSREELSEAADFLLGQSGADRGEDRIVSPLGEVGLLGLFDEGALGLFRNQPALPGRGQSHAHVDERDGDGLQRAAVVDHRHLVVGVQLAGREEPVDLPDAGHAVRLKLDSAEHAHARSPEDPHACLDGLQNLLGRDREALEELPVHDADGVRHAFAQEPAHVPAFDRGEELGVEDGTRLLTAKTRSAEHTSELQSRFDLVCRLLLEKKKTQTAYPSIDKNYEELLKMNPKKTKT